MSQNKNHLIIRKRRISPEGCGATESHLRTNGPKQNCVDYLQYVDGNKALAPPPKYPQVGLLIQEHPKKMHISESTSSLLPVTIQPGTFHKNGNVNILSKNVIRSDGNKLPSNTTTEVLLCINSFTMLIFKLFLTTKSRKLRICL